MSEEKLVPKLRFSGFNDEWETKMLKDVSTINPKTKDLPNEFVYIDLDSVENGILTKKNKICIEDAPSRAQRLLDVNDILFQTVRPYQMNNLYFDYDDDNYVASTGYAQIKSKINSRYLYHYLHYSKFVNEVLKRCTGTSYPAINANDLKKIKIKIPSDLDEQMFIGSIFDRIDEKIELLEKKHQYYQYFKKFLMQQIFAQKLRFDFVEVKLKDISKINKGEQLNKDVMIEDGKYYVLNGGKDPSGYTNEWNVSENTITISEGGNSCGYVNFNTEKFWSGGHCYYLSNLDENVDDYYLYNYLKFKEKFIMHLRVGSGLPNIQKRDIENIKIQIISKNNQNKISNLFLFVDKKINSIQIQKENFENFKKGLLQQMFV